MNWDKIREEYESTDITLKALADKHEIKLGTLKSRKSREKWERDATSQKDATNRVRDATPSNKMQEQPKEEKPVFVESEGLTDKQRLFCMYYLKYFNATKAYQKAYDSSYAVANVEGYRNLVKPRIKQEIDRQREIRTDELGLSARDILQKYIDIAFSDITDFTTFGKKYVPAFNPITGEPLIDDDGNEVMNSYNFVDFHDSAQIDGTIVTEVKQGKDGISVKLADKMKALEMLTKYFDFLPEHQKRRLEEEKIKVGIDKTKAETEHLTKDEGTGPIEIRVTQAVKADG